MTLLYYYKWHAKTGPSTDEPVKKKRVLKYLRRRIFKGVKDKEIEKRLKAENEKAFSIQEFFRKIRRQRADEEALVILGLGL